MTQQSEISRELVERCVALVRDVAEGKIRTCDHGVTRANAAAIVAELPKPVDPDIEEMRQIYAHHFATDTKDRSPTYERNIRDGLYDDAATGRMILAALKRGRSLATKPQGDAA